jgi:hypothetical protein
MGFATMKKVILMVCLIFGVAVQRHSQAQSGVPSTYTGTFEYRQEYAGIESDGTKLKPYTKLISGTVTFTKTEVDRTGDFEQFRYKKVSWTMTQAPFKIITERGGNTFECAYAAVSSSFSGMESYGLAVNVRNRIYSFSFGQGNKPQPSTNPTCNYAGAGGAVKQEMADLRELDQVLSNPKMLAGKSTSRSGPFTTTKTWSFKAR